MEEIKNAIVTKFYLGKDDHGIYSFCLMFNMGDVSQGTGHYCLWSKNDPETDSTGKLVRGLLEIFEVDDISKIAGQYCRIKRYDSAWNSPIEEVGNILKDKWLKVRTLELLND